MASTLLTAPAILTPEEVGSLVVQPTLDLCQARNVATMVGTDKSWYRIPIVKKNPSVAWVTETGEIPVSDAELAEVDVRFGKMAGLSVVSNELAMDSSPEASQLIGERLAGELARMLDTTFFGGLPSPAPSGLEALAGVNTIDASAGVSSLDVFAEAMNNAEAHGTQITAFVASPSDSLALTQLKQFSATGSNMPLLGSDPSQPTRRSIFGVPLLVSAGVTPGHVWAVPQDRTNIVVRSDATVTADSSVFFTSDRTAVRAVLRCGFAFTQPEAITKIVTVAPAKGA